MTTTTVERPPKWDAWRPENERAPDEAWEAVPDESWRIPPLVEQSECRWGSPRNGYCKRPAVAVLRRGKQNRWWAYCERHLYGRWVEGGQVLIWRIRREWWQRDA